jgi:hypothetical protein
MAKQRPKMPVPQTELMPQELLEEIRRWAAEQGYITQSRPAAQEYALVTVRDPDGGFTTTLIPNPHHGRRLAKHKVRYTVQQLNSGWRN